MPPKRLAEFTRISASELYAMLDGGVSASIDRLAAFSTALFVTPQQLLEAHPS